MFTDSYDKIGVIGLGIIGTRVAECLRSGERHVYVWNRSPKPVPNFLSSPAEIAQLANVIQIFVTNGEALLDVVDRLEGRLTKKHIILNCSTVDPDSVIQAGKKIAEQGAEFLDAPFTGSRVAAERGALVYYIGGDPTVLEKVRPVLEVSSREIVFIGKVGDASLIKIATNMISATTVQVLCEAYALTMAAGLPPEKLIEALENNACGSDLTQLKLPAIVNRDYEPHFSLKNMFKDAQFALNLANQYKVDMPALSTAASVMFRTIQKGHGEKDYSVLASNYQGDLAEVEPIE
ncbi:MAG: NAD(P)-dependent oxidoreductase [Verrucomicrobiales bacterium]|nr:NAD(P)-dependent oxidoreductase [Verrucomicrobiales bacterium]